MNKNIFSYVDKPYLPKSVQDLSHSHSLSCNMGELIPVAAIDCLPGDKVHLDNEVLLRTMPLVTPPFERFNVTFHRFFVPKRLLWDHWDEYVSMTKIGSPAALPIHPFFECSPTDMELGPGNYIRLWNYLGIPLRYDPMMQITSRNLSPFWQSCYQFIYNEYYRDQNLIPEVLYKLPDGDAAVVPGLMESLKTLRKRAWKHDYFTSALPFVQKGDPVLMPMQMTDSIVRRNADPALGTPPGELTSDVQTGNVSFPISGAEIHIDNVPNLDPLNAEGLYADNENAQVLTTINDFRRANAIQRFKERLARVGSRFTEFLRGVFGVRSRDARLQRPEYIGGLVKPITISEVLNTTGTTDAPQGAMAGHGATYINGSRSSFFCEEHGIIMIIMNIQPNGKYFQGFPKDMLKINHPTEIYVPDLANLGEQAIENDELYAFTPTGTGEFGYVPRWTEHRYMPNRVSGQMADTLLIWTGARKFGTPPALNQVFIEADQADAADRLFVVEDPTDEKLVCEVFNTVQMVRSIPQHGTPSL